MVSSWLSKVILLASSSLISTNWSDFTLSTCLWGKDSAAGERTKLVLGLVFVSCGRTGFAGGGLVVVVVVVQASLNSSGMG